MSIWSMLYQLIIAPLRIIMEFIYGAAYNVLGSAGGAIIPLSFVVNFLLLPFYKRADAIQREERDTEKRMAAGLVHIKSTYCGDERFMMQQAFYRVNHYKPVYALRSALPLLLQIPFFIAAYGFLSTLTLFEGIPFCIVLDLSRPDSLLKIGGTSVNLLPILMTLINILSSEIFTRDLGLKNKLQLHAMALVFFVLLYNSPSGLVIYWTLNNIFSLAKNIVSKAKDPNKTSCFLFSALGGAILAYAIWGIEEDGLNRIIVFLVAIAFQIPTISLLLRKNKTSQEAVQQSMAEEPWLFLSGCLLLALLTGVMIPLSVISASPAEFIMVSDFRSPLIYVFQAFLLGVGFFVIWMGLFHFLMSKRTRRAMVVIIWILCLCGITNFMLFGTDLGLLNSQLQFEKTPAFTQNQLLINSEVMLAVTAIVIIIWMKKKGIIATVAPVLILAVLGISIKDMCSVQAELPQIKVAIEAGLSEHDTIRLSRDGKNVVVIMMDSMISSFVPYMIQEKPELLQQYDGFTWYPNTLSYGPATNTGVPGVFGGYEYIPEEMNRKSEKSLAEKQNEALKLMPVLFDEAGYQVTVCDPTYANYSWIPDVSIYDTYPTIKAFNTESGQILNEYTENSEAQFKIWKRNFFCYSVMKVSPLIAQIFLYQEGTYYNPDRYGVYLLRIQIPDGLSKASGSNESFLKSYGALSALSHLTQVLDTERNSFFMISNGTAHDLMMLQEPDYVPSYLVDNTDYDNSNTDRYTVNGHTMKVNTIDQVEAYQVNMAAMLKLGEWFDYLRDEEVYDNTRIIIVSDHGRSLKSFDDMLFGTEEYENIMRYNPILFVKDFDSRGFSQNDSFMTNADTPLLAFEGLIEDPVNPATGKPVTNETKKENEQHVFFTEEWQTNENNGNTFLPGIWLSLKGHNIFDTNNWTIVGEY